MPLRPHQQTGANEAYVNPGYMLAHDMGTGKTYTGIHILNHFDARKVLILAPKTVCSIWKPEFIKWSVIKYDVHVFDKKGVAKKAKDIKKVLKLHNDKSHTAIVINYDSAWRAPLGPVYNDKNRIIDAGILMSTEWDYVIADEVHRIKGPGSKVSWFLKRLGQKSKRRLGLTGTPMPHSPLDIYAQYRFLNPDIFGTSFVNFKKRYAVLGGYENKQVIGWQNMAELNKKFYSIAHLVKSDDVLNLPKRTSIKRSCHLSPSAMKIYNALNNEFISEIGDGDTISVDMALTKMLRLAQITGGYAEIDDDDKKERNGKIIDNSKIDAVKDILQDLPKDEPVVIVTRFTNEIDRIQKLCESKAVDRTTSILKGGIDEHRDWKACKTNVLIAQIQCAREGIDLTRSRYCIWYSVGYSLGDFEQMIKREHRDGQLRKVFNYFLVSEGTVDNLIMLGLKHKKNVVSYVQQSIKDFTKLGMTKLTSTGKPKQ
jgi:SNF2 family DNA or RNA helicase